MFKFCSCVHPVHSYTFQVRVRQEVDGMSQELKVKTYWWWRWWLITKSNSDHLVSGRRCAVFMFTLTYIYISLRIHVWFNYLQYLITFGWCFWYVHVYKYTIRGSYIVHNPVSWIGRKFKRVDLGQQHTFWTQVMQRVLLFFSYSHDLQLFFGDLLLKYLDMWPFQSVSSNVLTCLPPTRTPTITAQIKAVAALQEDLAQMESVMAQEAQHLAEEARIRFGRTDDQVDRSPRIKISAPWQAISICMLYNMLLNQIL